MLHHVSSAMQGLARDFDIYFSFLKKTLVRQRMALFVVQSITFPAKAAVPKFDKTLHQLTDRAAANLGGRAYNFRPGVHARASLRLGLKHHPLFHGVAERVIDPGNVVRRRTKRDHMIHGRSHWPYKRDLQAAARSPRAAAQPADVAVVIGEPPPAATIRK